ncbi:MAG: hypothetical protein AABZ02_11120, partial [Bacteroidota bacterium]
RVARIVLGIVLMILGVLALLTPFTPGSWLALIGLELLGLRLVFQRKLLSLLPQKYRRRIRDVLERKLKKRKET